MKIYFSVFLVSPEINKTTTKTKKNIFLHRKERLPSVLLILIMQGATCFPFGQLNSQPSMGKCYPIPT
jgi:hypothetical protein